MNADLSVAAITDGILHYGSPSHRESSGLVGAGAAGAAPAWLLQPCCPAGGTACPGSALRRSLPPFANLVQTLCKPSAGARAGPSGVSGTASMPCAGVCFLPTATEPEQWPPVPGGDG